MPIVQSGSINTTALVVPDLYVQIVPPQTLYLNGVPTNIVGVVGTAALLELRIRKRSLTREPSMRCVSVFRMTARGPTGKTVSTASGRREMP